MSIAGLILAAGGSSRMKTPKQLLPWGKDSLLEQVIQSARDSDLDTIYLVLGAESDRIKQQADLNNVVILENKEWEKGLGTSIATGIAALSKKEDIHGCVILLADQPFITDEYIDAMIQAFDPETIIASDYNGRAGVPCLFPKMYFPDLKKLQGDQGAGKLLAGLKDKVQILDKPADLRDIDTPEAYQKHLPK